MPRRRTSILLIAALLPSLLLIGCDRQSSEAFSVEVRVEGEQGNPVDEAEVAVRPCYETSGNEAVCESNAVRASLAEGNTPGAPQNSAARSADPRIAPIFPNPFGDGATLRVEVVVSSTVQSAVYTLNGAQAHTIVDGTVSEGTHLFQWRPNEVPDGLYQIRSRIRTGQAIVARDTAYAAVMRDPINAAVLGSTDASGQVSTRARTPFPHLFPVPAFDVRDANGNRLGEMRVTPTVQFVVTTPTGQQTYRRSVEDGTNSFTLTLDD